jgi:hypothetical protein
MLDKTDPTHLEQVWNELEPVVPAPTSGLLNIVPEKELGQGGTRHTMVITDVVVDPAGDVGAGLLTMLCPPKKEGARRGPKVKLGQYAEILSACRQLGREEGKEQSPPTVRPRLVGKLLEMWRNARGAHAVMDESDEARAKRRIHLLVKAARDWRNPPAPPKGK